MAGPQSNSGADTAQSKRIRVTHACDQCNQTRSKCDGNLPCARCSSIKLTCAYLRARKKRGKVRKPGHTHRAIRGVAGEPKSQGSGYACTRDEPKGGKTPQPISLSPKSPAHWPHLTPSHESSPSISLGQIEVTGDTADGETVADTKDKSPALTTDATVRNRGDKLYQVEQGRIQTQRSDFPLGRSWPFIQTTSQPRSTDPLHFGVHTHESEHELQDPMHLSTKSTTEEVGKWSSGAKLSESIPASSSKNSGNVDNSSASAALGESPQGRVTGGGESCVNILCRTLRSLVRQAITPQTSAAQGPLAFDGPHAKEIISPGCIPSDLAVIVPVSVGIELLEHFFSDRSEEYTRRRASQLSAEEIKSLVDNVARGVISSRSALIISALLMAAQTSDSRFLMSPPSARTKVSQKLRELTTHLLASVPLSHADVLMTTDLNAMMPSEADIISDAATLVHLTFATTPGGDTGSRWFWSMAACAQISDSNDEVETWLDSMISAPISDWKDTSASY